MPLPSSRLLPLCSFGTFSRLCSEIKNPYHTVWLAVVFSAWYCGLGPSIVTTLLGALGVWYLFLPPPHSLDHSGPGRRVWNAWFLVFSSAIIALGSRIDEDSPLGRGWLPSLNHPRTPSLREPRGCHRQLECRRAAHLRLHAAGGHRPVDCGSPNYSRRELQEEEKQILSRVRRGEHITNFETVRLNKNGARLDISLTISPVRNSRGDICSGASDVARDITDRKQAEETIRESEAEKAIKKRNSPRVSLSFRMRKEDTSRANYTTAQGNFSLLSA